MLSIVQVPVAPAHPRLVERAARSRAEIERLLTPEALAELDRRERVPLTGEPASRS